MNNLQRRRKKRAKSSEVSSQRETCDTFSMQNLYMEIIPDSLDKEEIRTGLDLIYYSLHKTFNTMQKLNIVINLKWKIM